MFSYKIKHTNWASYTLWSNRMATFEWLNSLSFPEISRSIQFFSRASQEWKTRCNFISDYATHFTVSLSFPGFSIKNSNFPRVFPEILTMFPIPWVFLWISRFSRSVATLSLKQGRTFKKSYMVLQKILLSKRYFDWGLLPRATIQVFLEVLLLHWKWLNVWSGVAFMKSIYPMESVVKLEDNFPLCLTFIKNTISYLSHNFFRVSQRR